MNVLKDLLHFHLSHLYIELPLKLFFLNWQCFRSFLNKFGNVFCLVCLLFYFHLVIVTVLDDRFGDRFVYGAGKVCLRTGITCCGGATWSFFKEETFFKEEIVLFLLINFVLWFVCFYRRGLMLLRLWILAYCDDVYFSCLVSGQLMYYC